MSKFKIGLTVIFSAFILIAIIVFAASKGAGGSTSAVSVTIWGFLPQQEFTTFVQASTAGTDKSVVINYVQESPTTFESDFVNALANGNGPDVVMISQDMLLQNENKLLIIPYANYNARTFDDSFIQEGSLFLTSTGVASVPFMVDPLVMYWNRDMFASAGIAQPPQYFDELLTLPLTLTKADTAGNITQSATALGEWSNVTNAKAILADILLTAGSPIVDTTGTTPVSALDNTTTGQAISPAEAAINFYTQFANPTSQTYSWNRSQPDSLDYFLSGNLAVYFGFASELATIRSKNPNLNFDVTAMLQPRQATNKVVFANLYGLSIVKQSKNPTADFQAITDLTSDASIQLLSTYTHLPPVKLSLLSVAPTDPYQTVFYQSALVSKGWLDPNGSATDTLLQNMIESITSGRAQTSDAISTANDQLNALLK